MAVILWEILTQKVPWEDATEHEILYKVCKGYRPDLPNTVNPEVRRLIKYAWLKNPEKRINAHDVAEALAEVRKQ